VHADMRAQAAQLSAPARAGAHLKEATLLRRENAELPRSYCAGGQQLDGKMAAGGEWRADAAMDRRRLFYSFSSTASSPAIR
jgi:hypothetical protein